MASPGSSAEEAPVPPGTADKGSISQSEAARQALAAGLKSPEEATEFLRKKFGIEMSKSHFSAVKSQLKKREGGEKPKGRSGRKPKAAIEGYLAPPPEVMPTGEGDLLGRPRARSVSASQPRHSRKNL